MADRRVGSQHELTARERDIAAQLVEGKTSKQIGKLLAISPRVMNYKIKILNIEIPRSRRPLEPVAS